MAKPKNKHKVPAKQWRNWSDGARIVFNTLFNCMRSYDDLKHPRAPNLAAAHWKTVRWNTAWHAASLYDEVSSGGFTSTAHPGGR
jgi:hypothetical protein